MTERSPVIDSPEWRASYAETRKREGGSVNDPDDPGKATYAGVALTTVRLRDRNGDGRLDFDFDGDGDVDAEDILEHLPRHSGAIERLFWEDYWVPAKCPALPWPWCMGVFDAAILHGPGASALLLQRALRIHDDGIVGLQTIRAAQLSRTSTVAWAQFRIERVELARRICVAWERKGKPKPWKFFEGWKNRAHHIEARGLRPAVIS